MFKRRAYHIDNRPNRGSFMQQQRQWSVYYKVVDEQGNQVGPNVIVMDLLTHEEAVLTTSLLNAAYEAGLKDA